MSELLQKALAAVTAAQPKDESTIWMVGEQLKDILRAAPELAQIVLDDFSAQKTPLIDCEKKIEVLTPTFAKVKATEKKKRVRVVA